MVIIEKDVKKNERIMTQSKNQSGQYLYTEEKEINYVKHANKFLNKSAFSQAKSY